MGFFSIKVAAGARTSVLQHIKPGEPVLVSSKPVGTLVVRDVRPGRVLYLLATGTGLAPFLSIVQDPEAYERFEKIVLVHGVRRKIDLAYHDYLSEELQPTNSSARRSRGNSSIIRTSPARRSAIQRASPSCSRGADCNATSAFPTSTRLSIAQ